MFIVVLLQVKSCDLDIVETQAHIKEFHRHGNTTADVLGMLSMIFIMLLFILVILRDVVPATDILERLTWCFLRNCFKSQGRYSKQYII